MYKTIINTIVLMSALASMNALAQTDEIQFCVQFAAIPDGKPIDNPTSPDMETEANYFDADPSHDFLSRPNDRNAWVVPNVPVTIERHIGQSLTFINWSLLDESGCTPFVEYTPGSYTVRVLGGILTETGRAFRILTKQETDRRNRQVETVELKIEAQQLPPKVGAFTKISMILTVPDSRISRTLPVINEAFQLMKRDEQVPGATKWPEIFSIHMAHKHYLNQLPLCDPYMVDYVPQPFGEDDVQLMCMGENRGKTIIAHEFGHAIDCFMKGPEHSGYSYKVLEQDSSKYAPAQEDLCNGSGVHGLTKRNFIGTASCEAFAELMEMAITMFQPTPQIDPQTGAVSYAKIRVGDRNLFSSPPQIGIDPIGDPNNERPGVRLMDRLCPPPPSFSRLGNKRDWLHFLWSLYAADPSVRYTIPQITSVWRNVPDDTIPAWCINRGTPGSEPDWTCKDLEWIYVSPTWKVITVGTYNGPQRTGVPEEIRKATKLLVGKPFSKLRSMATRLYGQTKGDHFAKVGYELRVDYDSPRHP